MKKLIADPFLASRGNLIDLGVGNPAFMFDYWRLIDEFYSGKGSIKVTANSNMSYDYEQAQVLLKNTIKKVHDFVGNAVTDGYEVVLGNGASHLISAWAYSTDLKSFHVNAPRWPRLNTLLQMGAVFAEDGVGDAQLVVTPNNPDNSINQAIKKNMDATAYDLCYNWPQYTKVIKHSEDVMIFGLAKATGHAGTRLGWALVKNPEQAKKMAKYIELSTSGVSQEAQIRAYTLLALILNLNGDFVNCFDYGADLLSKRWTSFTLATKNNSMFKVLNSNGMFAWCEWLDQTQDPVVEIADKYKANVIGGEAFGASPSHFRVSLGCYGTDFDQFILNFNGASHAKT